MNAAEPAQSWEETQKATQATGEGYAGGFPFEAAMAFGLGVLRLSPDDFWGMSLPELLAARQGASGKNLRMAVPPDRRALDALMARFPDSPTRAHKEA